MYVVVQEIKYKEPRSSFTKQGIEVYTATDAEGYEYYAHREVGDVFERDITTAYKISIHESYRENGQVKKRQWHVTTACWYTVAEGGFQDALSSWRIKQLSEKIGKKPSELYKMLFTKLEPLENDIFKTWQEMPEYKAHREQWDAKVSYQQRSKAFDDIYGYGTYNRCYDFYDTLRNPEYLEQLIAEKKARDEYTKRSYQQSYERTYNEYKSSYSQTPTSNYDDNEKKMLKKLYRTMSKQFHPDVTGDDGEMMKLLTKLKEEWGV